MDTNILFDKLFTYLKSDENIKDCEPFTTEIKRLQAVKELYSQNCYQAYLKVYENVIRKEFATGGETINRGYYCPSPIYDIIVGNCNRGKLLKRLQSRSKPSYEYGFDKYDNLIIVKNDVFEFIKYENNTSLGIKFSIIDNEVCIIGINECTFNKQKQITKYIKVSYLTDDDIELYEELYSYKSTGLSNAETFEYTELFGYPSLNHSKFEFFHDENGYLSSYIATDLTKPQLYSLESNTSTHKVTEKRKC